MRKELRQTKRIALSTQPEGELHVYSHGECYSVYSVLNVSSDGISVQLKNSVEISAEVEIQYKHKDIDLRVNGIVVWNRKKKNWQKQNLPINLMILELA